MMGAAALTRLLVLHIRGRAQRIMRTTLVALHRRYFSLGNSHFLLLAMARCFSAKPVNFTAASRLPAPLAGYPITQRPGANDGSGANWGRLILHSWGSARASSTALSARHDAANGLGLVARPPLDNRGLVGGPRAWGTGIAGNRIWQRHGQLGRLAGRKPTCRPVEMGLRGGFGPEDARAPFGDVEVDLQDATLRPE